MWIPWIDLVFHDAVKYFQRRLVASSKDPSLADFQGVNFTVQKVGLKVDSLEMVVSSSICPFNFFPFERISTLAPENQLHLDHGITSSRHFFANASESRMFLHLQISHNSSQF